MATWYSIVLTYPILLIHKSIAYTSTIPAFWWLLWIFLYKHTFNSFLYMHVFNSLENILRTTQEAEIRIEVWSQPGQIVWETLSQKKKKKSITKRAGGAAQGVGPEFKPSTTKKRKEKKESVNHVNSLKIFYPFVYQIFDMFSYVRKCQTFLSDFTISHCSPHLPNTYPYRTFSIKARYELGEHSGLHFYLLWFWGSNPGPCSC
jgi:hypothetical protein